MGLWASSVFIIKASYLLEVGKREDTLCRNEQGTDTIRRSQHRRDVLHDYYKNDLQTPDFISKAVSHHIPLSHSPLTSTRGNDTSLEMTRLFIYLRKGHG